MYKLLFLMSFILLYSCASEAGENHPDQAQDIGASAEIADKEAPLEPNHDSINDEQVNACLNSLLAVFMSSNFRDSLEFDLEGAYLLYDHAEGDTLMLSLQYENEERHSFVAIQNYNLILHMKKLLNVTYDLENPIELHFDTTLVDEKLKICLPLEYSYIKLP